MTSFFTVTDNDSSSDARAGVLRTAHGEIRTPVFMPVGTRAAVKTLQPRLVEELGAEIILGNTYHLLTRPGPEIIEHAGGLHEFMSWSRPILTDSGGFQVYSLSSLRNITDEGVVFHSHIDGKRFFMGPKESMAIQHSLGSDIAMVFDECPPSTAERTVIADAVRRSAAWARICHQCICDARAAGSTQRVFAIAQGGVDEDLRRQSCEELCTLSFDGYAIGGLAVGEPAEEMYRVTSLCCSLLPRETPRYLMGVGTPENIVEAVLRGVDMFDCVMPTRNARNGMAFTRQGNLQVKAGRYKDDHRPVEQECECYTCRTFTRAYVRHLLNVGESLGGQLLTLHNIYFYLQLMRDMRKAIQTGDVQKFARTFHARRASGGEL